jgi:hypothetical protein
LKFKWSKNAGILLVTGATFVYLFSYTIIFVLDDFTTICIVDRVAQEQMDKESLIRCVTDNHETKLNMFVVGVITSLAIIIGNVLVATARNGKSQN